MPICEQAAVMNQRLDRVSAALRCFDRFLALVRRATRQPASAGRLKSFGRG